MKFVEVCAGAGGLSTGFMSAGWEALYLCDNDRWCVETLRNNHEGVEVEDADMTQLDLTRFKGQVDCLAGGVPCQSFSQAGRGEGVGDPRGQLLYAFNNLIQQIEPRSFVVENVKALTQRHNMVLNEVMELFRNGGRYVLDYDLLNANNHGVPQKRERVFIVGVRADIATPFRFPQPQAYRPVLGDVLPAPESDGVSYPEHKAEVMRQVPEGGNWRNLPEEIQRQYMGANFLRREGGMTNLARRLSRAEATPTLTTSPNQKMTERCHPTETRPLTIREYARIQTFPDDYVFSGGVGQQYKQIGNAVPCKLAQTIAEQMKATLEPPQGMRP